jgi:hypothetical protein
MRFLILVVVLLCNALVFSQEWELPVIVSDGNTDFELRFGIHPDATDGYDADFDTKVPPPSLSENFDTRCKPFGSR